MEEKIVWLESKQNSLAQYGRRNNVVSSTPDSIDDDNLENTIISMMSDINVNLMLDQPDDQQNWQRWC